MAFKVSHTEQKIVPGKKKIQVNNIFVKDLKLVDETGDITNDVLNEIPNDIDTVSFSITIESPIVEE